MYCSATCVCLFCVCVFSPPQCNGSCTTRRSFHSLYFLHGQSVRHFVSQLPSQSVSQSTSQAVSKLACLSASQPTSQSVIQSVMASIGWLVVSHCVSVSDGCSDPDSLDHIRAALCCRGPTGSHSPCHSAATCVSRRHSGACFCCCFCSCFSLYSLCRTDPLLFPPSAPTPFPEMII